MAKAGSANTPPQLRFRAALSEYASAHVSVGVAGPKAQPNANPPGKALVEVLRALASAFPASGSPSALALKLAHAVEGSAGDQALPSQGSPELLKILGRLDRLLGEQAPIKTQAHQQHIEQRAQRLIAELDIIRSQKQRPLAALDQDHGLEESQGIDQQFLAPWPVAGTMGDHWLFEFGISPILALPVLEAIALLEAPTLFPIQSERKHLEGQPLKATLWGFRGLEWENTPLPVVALTPPHSHRGALGRCTVVLKTPREVASDFAHFGLLCPTLPRIAAASKISQDRHCFIDSVAVVRAMNGLFE